MRDRLPDPPDRIGDELDVALRVEAARRFDQPEVALVNEIEKGDAEAAVALRVADDEAQVAFDQPLAALRHRRCAWMRRPSARSSSGVNRGRRAIARAGSAPDPMGHHQPPFAFMLAARVVLARMGLNEDQSALRPGSFLELLPSTVQLVLDRRDLRRSRGRTRSAGRLHERRAEDAAPSRRRRAPARA